MDLEVGKDAPDFDQIKVNDKFRIEYHESVAIYLGKPGTHPEADAGLLVARSAKGETPGGYAAGAVDVSAAIVGIDKGNHTVTLELPEGNVVTTEVDPSVKAFEMLKVGMSLMPGSQKPLRFQWKKQNSPKQLKMEVLLCMKKQDVGKSQSPYPAANSLKIQ